MERYAFSTKKDCSWLLVAQLLLAGCTAGRESSRSMQEDTQEFSEQTAPAAGAHGRMIVKCIITPEGTIARCRVIQAVAGMEAEVLTSLYMMQTDATVVQGKPVFVDYTFNVTIPPSESTPSAPTSRGVPATMTRGRPAPSQTEAQRTEAELRQRAVFLCRHQLLDAPVTSRLPFEVDPSLLIRREDLLFHREHSSSDSLTELDRRGLYEDLSHSVSCGVTEVRVSENMAVVSLERAAPPWKELPSGLLDSEDVLKPREPVHRIEALGRWAKANPARYPLSVHRLLFVKSSEGWRANYQLPEKDGGVGEGP